MSTDVLALALSLTNQPTVTDADEALEADVFNLLPIYLASNCSTLLFDDTTLEIALANDEYCWETLLSLETVYGDELATIEDSDTSELSSDKLNTVQLINKTGDIKNAAQNKHGPTQPEEMQWVLCDDCGKWRKVSASLTIGEADPWTCDDCDVPQEEYEEQETTCLVAKYIAAYGYHFKQKRTEADYTVIRSDSAIANELLNYLSFHSFRGDHGVVYTSDVRFWRYKKKTTSEWISNHSRKNKNSAEPPLDELKLIRAYAAFQALTDCLRYWEGNKELSENKLQVMFERTFYPELFDPIPEDEAEKTKFMRKYDAKRGAKMSPGSMQNCFHHMLGFIAEKKKTKKRKRNNNTNTSQQRPRT